MARITKAAKRGFLDALAEGLTVSAAATRAGHARWSFYRLKVGDGYEQKGDPQFAAAWDEAAERGEAVRDDAVRAEIQRRAVDGIDEPVFYQGEVVGYVRRYSDTLLLAMANNLLPEYDHPARVEHTGPGGTPLEIKLAFDPAIPAAAEAPELAEVKQLPRVADDGA